MLLLCIIALNALSSPSFLGMDNQINLFALSIEKVIVALIMTFVILNAEIDLSVASMMGLSACALGWLVEQGVPMPASLVICLLVGILGGAFNGFWITVARLPSLVVTLAMLIGFRGLARVLVEDRSIKAFPPWFEALGQQPLLGPFPLALLIFFALLVLAVIVLRYSGFGRQVYVIGINQEVARYSGSRSGGSRCSSSPLPASSPRSPGSCSRRASARCGETWGSVSSWTSSPSSCSEESAYSAGSARYTG